MSNLAAEVPQIAIIDDNESFRIAIAGLVRSLGYAALTFELAQEFLQSPALHKTSCVISDVQMPVIDGIELQSRLTTQNIPTPIIFITALSDVRIQERALQRGAVCFLKKPFDEQLLIKGLHRALRQDHH